MIRRLELCESGSFDPYHNLAVEQHLLETVAEDCCILFLWQNESTVVIGRNQNAWRECRTTLLEREGGRLARRLSGGGAVFHDLGNLNFTFLTTQANYDLDRQLAVILETCRGLGLRAERSGRNDMLAEGRKFSGSAFYKHGGRAYHHGTLLVETDMDRMARYLAPSPSKLEGKGVDSVRSRVVNLRELAPGVTVPLLKDELSDAFQRIHGLPCAPLPIEGLDPSAIGALYRRNRSWAWNYGRQEPFTFTCEGRFPWGGVQLALRVEGGVVETARVYTDAMDWTLSPRLEESLAGSPFSLAALEVRIAAAGLEEGADLRSLLEQQEI